MKICITGPSGSGKTTLAAKIAKLYKITHINSENIFYLREDGHRGRVNRSEQEITRGIDATINMDAWVFEGVHIIPEIIEAADKIIWIKPPLPVTLYQQWKRYFTNSQHRKEWSIFNNVKLTKIILKYQYLGKEDTSRFDDPKYAHMKKVKKILAPYTYKVEILSEKHERQNLPKLELNPYNLLQNS